MKFEIKNDSFYLNDKKVFLNSGAALNRYKETYSGKPAQLELHAKKILSEQLKKGGRKTPFFCLNCNKKILILSIPYTASITT